jgi:hypothetical protein
MIEFKILLIVSSLASLLVQGDCAEVQNSNHDTLISNESWPREKLCAVAANYYQSIADKKIEEKVVTLNDLSEIIVEQELFGVSAPKTARSAFVRWGKKPCSLSFLYNVIETDNSSFKKDFKEIFGKQVKYYQVVYTSYFLNGEQKATRFHTLDPSGMWNLDTFSKLDLWLMDEDGNNYVILSYEPARKFKGNLNSGVLKRLGVKNAKLWDY